MYYEQENVDEQGWKDHSLDKMVGGDLSETVIMTKVFICPSNPCSPYTYVFGTHKWLPK